MMFPDDPTLRADAIMEAFVRSGREHIDSMDPEMLRSYARLASEAPNTADVVRTVEVGGRWIAGTIAGGTLYHVLASGGEMTLTEARQRVCARLKGVYQIEPKTIENDIWPRFKRVAHLWAAYNQTSRRDPTFPCKPEDLPLFLAEAEKYRMDAERVRAKRAPRMLLEPGEAVCVPDDVTLPVVEITYEEGDLADWSR